MLYTCFITTCTLYSSRETITCKYYLPEKQSKEDIIALKLL